MLLSKLVFLSVKNVIYLSDTSFNYDGFINGDFDNDIDYATNIHNVFSPLNEAIARLQDLERLPYEVEQVTISADRLIDLTNLQHEVRQVVNVAQVGSDGSYKKLSHTMFGRNKLRVNSPYLSNNSIYIEYKQNIPTFSEVDFEEDFDLWEKYGIDNAMTNYIIEYVQGKLLEPIAPELANMHLSRAEAYFSNIPTAQQSFPQVNVVKKYTIGD